jgi:AhpC/TSA family
MHEINDEDQIECTAQRRPIAFEIGQNDVRQASEPEGRDREIHTRDAPSALLEVARVAAGAASEIERPAGRQESRRFDDQPVRLGWSIAGAIARIPIHAITIPRVSLTGALRYAWKSVVGGGSMLKVGDAAPDFEVSDHNGKRVKLRDFRGKKVLLWFFPKADTPG